MDNGGNSEVVVLPITSSGHSKAFPRFTVKMFCLGPPFSTGHGLVRRTGVWQLIEVRYLERFFELLLLSMELPLLPSVVRRACFFTAKLSVVYISQRQNSLQASRIPEQPNLWRIGRNTSSNNIYGMEVCKSTVLDEEVDTW